MSNITRRLRALHGELVTVQAFLQEHPGYSTAVANAQLLLERMKKQIAAVLDTEGDQPVATRHSVEDEVRESFLRGHLDTEGDRLTPLHILDPQIYEADWDGELDPEVFQGQKFVRLEEYRKLQGIAAPERDTRPLAPPTDAAMSTDGEDGQ